MPAFELDQIRRSKLRLARTSSKTLFSSRALRPTHFCQEGDRGATNLRKKGCPDYDKLKQLFALSTATGHLQISSNTPALTSDEEHALEEELANDGVATHVDEDCYTPNLESIPVSAKETPNPSCWQTSHARRKCQG